jgi:hypothetical protein
MLRIRRHKLWVIISILIYSEGSATEIIAGFSVMFYREHEFI